MKASVLKEDNIDIKEANLARKNLCNYLKTLKDTAIDIF